MSAIDPCWRIVKGQDRERFATLLFAPAPARDRLMALYALDCEIDRIPAMVREPAAGFIRLLWWREAMAGSRDVEARGHPILAHLVGAGLPADLLERRFDVGERLLDGPVPADPAAIEALAMDSSGSIHEMAAILLGADDETSRTAARLAGTAWGLVRIIRARSGPAEALAGRALAMLDEARRLPFAAAAMPALLVAVPARIALAHPQRRPRPMPLRLAWAAFSKRV